MPPELVLRDRKQFRVDPEGGAVAGENWVYFCFDKSLFGYAVWGRPGGEDIDALCAFMETELDRPLHNAVVYLRDVEGVSPEAFRALAAFSVQNAEALGRIIEHTAIVRPTGLGGAVVAGFFDVVAKPFPVSMCAQLDEAFTLVGRKDAEACAAALMNLCQSTSGQDALLRDLRVHLTENLDTSEAAPVARSLGMSVRTLQRRLSKLNTTFAKELHQTRISEAKRLLLDSDTPVTTLAITLGFPSSQRFATAFREETGRTPTEYRRS
ncbi:MAG: helix-turn-helix transcriptional regulator, partial [Myxococcales bacterium]|nr:helix-turn-helix transcriptional regulator [Myxococcales bacterium]